MWLKCSVCSAFNNLLIAIFISIVNVSTFVATSGGFRINASTMLQLEGRLTCKGLFKLLSGNVWKHLHIVALTVKGARHLISHVTRHTNS